MIRITPVYVQGKENHIVLDCATGGDSTSGGIFDGNVIDLQAFPMRFTHAQPVLAGTLPGTTSTAGGSRLQLDVRLKHGDSSGGGDAVAFSTDQLPSTVQSYYATDMSTDHPSWSTGTIRAQYSPAAIPLLGAKRYIRASGQVTRIGIATSTAAAQLFTCHLGLNLLGAQEEDAGRDKAVNPSGSYNKRFYVPTTGTNT
jgi:hypothetical protein